MNSAHGELLNPEQLRSVAFTPPRLGRRGLDEAQVRAFCDWVSDGVGRLLSDNGQLQAEVAQLRERLLEGQAGAGIRPDDVHIQAVSVLSRAQQTADRYVADAQEYSRELAEEGRLRRDEIVREAKARASAILAEARAHAGEAAGVARDGGGDSVLRT